MGGAEVGTGGAGLFGRCDDLRDVSGSVDIVSEVYRFDSRLLGQSASENAMFEALKVVFQAECGKCQFVDFDDNESGRARVKIGMTYNMRSCDVGQRTRRARGGTGRGCVQMVPATTSADVLRSHSHCSHSAIGVMQQFPRGSNMCPGE